MTSVDANGVRQWLRTLNQMLLSEHDRLDQLDSGAGDGDHGATMVLGFRRIMAVLDDRAVSPCDVIRTAGRSFAGVGGSIGPLWGLAFLRAAQAVDGHESLDGAALAKALNAAALAMQTTGSAQPGDRTLLDAALPAAQAFADAVKVGGQIDDAAAAGWRAALDGARATAEMVAKRGRASRNPTLAVGRVDPGAASMALAWTAAVCPGALDEWRSLVDSSIRMPA
jgi:dihydroxyacetone kinase-like protein